jgi:MFS family permease
VFMLLGLGMVGIGLNLGVHATVALAWIQQLGSGMTIPVLLGWSLRELPSRFRGRGMGWWASAFFLGQFVSPLFVGLVNGWSGGLLNTFIFAGGLCIAIAVGNALLSRRFA